MAGVVKKVWIFLSRIKREISEENVLSYMSRKLNKQKTDFTIKEIPTRENGNKCFMIGADYTLKDELYQPTFWPNGVGYKRFDFGLYRRFHEHDKQDFH